MDIPFISASEAAEKMGYSVQRIKQLAAGGGIPSAFKNRSGWQIPAEWAEAGREKEKPGPKKQ